MEKDSKRENCSRFFESIPPETVTEILSRLPVESIMVCKSVCKLWNSLTNHNYFTDLQLSNSTHNLSCSHVLFEAYLLDSVAFYLSNLQTGKVGEIRGFPLAKYNQMRIRSSFHGLICISPISNSVNPIEPVVIFNPLIIGDYIRLPESKIDQDMHKVCMNITLGFDYTINKYKVIRIYNIGQKNRCTFCEVITIGGKDTSWRPVKLPQGSMIYYSQRIFDRGDGIYQAGVYHQGSVYWIIPVNDKPSILKLDLSKEVFDLITFPESIRAPVSYMYSPKSINKFTRFQSLGGYLFLTEVDGWTLHVWKIVEQDSRTRVAGYKSIQTEVRHQSARVLDLKYLNDYVEMLLQKSGRSEAVRSMNRMRVLQRETQFSFYRRASKKNIQLPDLKILFSGAQFVNVWRFKASLVSIKEAMINDL